MWERDGHRLRCRICGFRVISELAAGVHVELFVALGVELAYNPEAADFAP